MSILGIQIVGDGGSAEKALAAAAEGAKQYGATVEAVAVKTTAKLEAQRARLSELSAAYRDLAASAVEGSDAQIAAAKLATDAEAKLARQVQVASGEAEAQTARLKEQALSMGAVTKEAKGLQGTVSKLSGSMALWLGAPLLGAGLASAIKETQKFSASMEVLHTQAGASQTEVKRMTTAVMGMASAVGTGPDALAQGLYHLESAGLRGQKAMDALRIAAEGARVGNANLEDVTNALNAVLVSGIKGSENYSQAMGALNATVGAGDMRMQDLAEAMGTGLPAKAALAGVSLRDVSAALAVLGDNNIRGAEAGTQLGSVLRLMAAPSKAAAKELAGLGLSATQLGDEMRTGGLPMAIEDLKHRMDAMGLTAAQQEVVLTRAFGGRQAQGILVLIDQLDRLKQKELDVGRGAQSFGSDWSAYQRQSQFATQRFQAALETLRIEVGQAVLPEFTKATKGLADWLDRMNKSGAAARDTKQAMHDLVAVVEGLHGAITAVDKATGGFTNTLELLLALKVAAKLAGWQTAFAGVATQSGEAGAAGSVGLLTTRLKNLLSLGIVTVTVDVLENLIPNKVTGGGQAILNGAGAGALGKIPLVGPVLQAGAYYGGQFGQAVSGPGNPNTNTGGAPSKQYTPAELAAYQAGLAGRSAKGLNMSVPGVMQAYSFGRQSGAHPISTGGASNGGGGAFTVNSGVDLQDENPMIPLALKNLASAGFKVDVTSGYRSYAQQAALYARYVKSGFNIKYIAAKPGQSNHESGNAVDVYVNGKPVDQSPAALAILKKYGLVADVAGDHEHLDLASGGTGGATGGTSGATPSAAELAALGLGPSGGTTKKPKKPPIISGAAEIPKDLQDAIAKYAGLAKTSSGSAALLYVQDEQANLEAARSALEKTLKGQTGKQAAATQREIDTLTKKIAVPTIISGKDLLPQSLLDAIQKAKDAATSSTGATAEGYLVSERKLLQKAKADLQDELTSASEKQARAIRQEINAIDTQIAGVSKSVATNLREQASAIKSNASSAIAQGRQAITSAFSNLINDVKSAFDAETQNYIDSTLAARFFQGGALTPLEQQLAGMQAVDTKQGLQDSIDQAKKQLTLDRQSADVTADQIAADQKAVDQAQRAYDENELQVQATAERKKADLDYADAVRKYQQERSDAEHSMNVDLTNLGKGIANGTQTLDGPGGLNDVLAKFGVTLTDVPADQFSSDMDTLSQAAQDLALVFVAEAKALAKVGDSKDAAAAAAAAAALNIGGVVTVPAAAQAALDAARQRGGKGAIPFATGGLVPGIFTGQLDTVDARLTPGEFVLTRDQVTAGLGGGGGSPISVQVDAVFPNYVGDHRELAAALKHPSVLEAVGTAVIKASRGGHLRQGDIRT